MINITNLREVSFPVYRLSSKAPQVDGGVVFTRNTYRDIDLNETYNVVKIVDDRNLPQPTIGSRRLHLSKHGVPLYPLRKAIYYLGDFLKAAKSGYWFIDSKGSIFQYEKTKRAKVKCVPIKSIVSPLGSTGSIVDLVGIPERFRTMYIPPKTHRYAAVLEYGRLRVLYGTYEDPFRESWRLI